MDRHSVGSFKYFVGTSSLAHLAENAAAAALKLSAVDLATLG